jgi:hypothetical protein
MGLGPPKKKWVRGHRIIIAACTTRIQHLQQRNIIVIIIVIIDITIIIIISISAFTTRFAALTTEAHEFNTSDWSTCVRKRGRGRGRGFGSQACVRNEINAETMQGEKI